MKYKIAKGKTFGMEYKHPFSEDRNISPKVKSKVFYKKTTKTK